MIVAGGGKGEPGSNKGGEGYKGDSIRNRRCERGTEGQTNKQKTQYGGTGL